MKADFQPPKTRSSFFSREPRFSLWIVIISTVVLLLVIFLSGLGRENPFSDLFCFLSVQGTEDFQISLFSIVLDQLTSVLEQIPR